MGRLWWGGDIYDGGGGGGEQRALVTLMRRDESPTMSLVQRSEVPAEGGNGAFVRSLEGEKNLFMWPDWNLLGFHQQRAKMSKIANTFGKELLIQPVQFSGKINFFQK